MATTWKFGCVKHTHIQMHINVYMYVCWNALPTNAVTAGENVCGVKFIFYFIIS